MQATVTSSRRGQVATRVHWLGVQLHLSYPLFQRSITLRSQPRIRTDSKVTCQTLSDSMWLGRYPILRPRALFADGPPIRSSRTDLLSPRDPTHYGIPLIARLLYQVLLHVKYERRRFMDKG